MWKLRTADVGFCASEGIGIGATTIFDTCLSLVNHLAFLFKWNHAILGNCEVNILKAVFYSASYRKIWKNWTGENQKLEWWGADPCVKWPDVHSMGRSALLKYILFSKDLKCSVNSLLGVSVTITMLVLVCLSSRNLCCLYLTAWILCTYAWIVISLTWDTLTNFGFTAEYLPLFRSLKFISGYLLSSLLAYSTAP